jgi:DNA-binding transcriptional regulator YhcF (GntR family)
LFGEAAGGRRQQGSHGSPGNHYFSRRQIGESRYRVTLTTLSRACQRLKARGLVTCLRGRSSHWSAVAITDRGRESLSADSWK